MTQTGSNGILTESWVVLWFAAVSYRTIRILMEWCSYRKVFRLVTTGGSSRNIHSCMENTWSTRIFEANIFMIRKALPKFTKYCLTKIWSHMVPIVMCDLRCNIFEDNKYFKVYGIGIKYGRIQKPGYKVSFPPGNRHLHKSTQHTFRV